ncbi:hypothetical protein TNCT_570051 [Trichonephila clavata]|uniref:Uncharacterized protein n=1 Tax=Trichonephila clavata TaxID=2740835 RepID=A0A8X6KRM5_TRICU|nr:hypothetical protein TNCT_570051 [Trichonephila clavata]
MASPVVPVESLRSCRNSSEDTTVNATTKHVMLTASLPMLFHNNYHHSDCLPFRGCQSLTLKSIAESEISLKTSMIRSPPTQMCL